MKPDLRSPKSPKPAKKAAAVAVGSRVRAAPAPVKDRLVPKLTPAQIAFHGGLSHTDVFSLSNALVPGKRAKSA